MSPPAAAAAAVPPGQKRTVNEALVYLKAVKDKFQDKRDKYEEFKQVLCDFNSGRIDTDGVIARVKTLFSGHPELIPGFKAFLPKGYENIFQDLEMEKELDKCTKAVNFVQKMKSRFQPVDHVYKSFLGILFQYYKSTRDACEEDAMLLHDHPDLLLEFRNYFLPDTSTAPQVVTGPTGVSVKHDNRNPIMASSRNVQSIPSSPTHISPPPRPLPVAPSRQKPMTNDALVYLKAVKDKFQEKRDKYEEFKQVLCDFNSGRIDTYGVIFHVKILLSGHPELILGFNAFLPKGYEIKLQDLEMKPVDSTKNLLNKIKSGFQLEDHVYNSFLGILDMHNKSMQDAYVQVATLFHDHPDLLEEFMNFLPDRSTALQAVTVPRGVSVRHGDRSPVMPSARNVQSIERERADPSTAGRDVSVDHPDLENDPQRRCIEKEKDCKVDQDRSNFVRDEKDGEHENKDSDRGQRKHEPFARMMERTCAETTHQGGASIFASLYTAKDDALKCVYTEELHFREKVKEKLDPEAYQEFLKCLHTYSQEIITRNELQKSVNIILQHYPDLLNGFNKFLEHYENIDGFLDGVLNKRQTSRTVKTVEKERHKDRDGEDWEREREKEREERERLDEGSAINSKEGTTHKSTAFSSKENYLWKPISELDLSNCQRCTPSYRLLPKNYPLPPASWTTDLGASVLNDLCVSVTSGSGGNSQNNQYEESLFRCEEDRFELDMLLESVNVAIKHIEELIEKMQINSIKPDNAICIDGHLTSLNMRCTEQLYGAHGLDVTDVLRKNASVALPVILTRLKQKQDEWSRCRSDFNKVWAEIYAKYHHKSLDHGSFI